MNFKSIIEFTQYFNTEEKCRLFLEEQRWGDSPACPHCGSTNVRKFATDNKTYKCREKVCRKKFTVTVGTIYENTKIPLTKWFLATYILSVHSKGISSLQLANWLNVTQKTAWFLNHRIREMLSNNAPELLNEIVEIDETYVGGKISNKHVSKRKEARKQGNKSMVVGAIQREGKVRTKVVQQANIENIQKTIVEFVEPNSTMITDESHAYNKVSLNYKHETINHRNKEYVRGSIHTNTIEGYWSVLKRQINGIHHFVSPKHLQRYCDESSYRYNTRSLDQDNRFTDVIRRCNGRLTYTALING